MTALIRLWRRLPVTLGLLLCPLIAMAHEGHGEPGTVGHDLQHQLWLFTAVVVVGALLLHWRRRKE